MPLPELIPTKKLQVPIPLALGKFEYLTEEELNDHANDIAAEQARRAAARDK